MTPLERRVWQLKRRSDALLVTLVFLLLGGFVTWQIRTFVAELQTLHVRWNANGDIGFAADSDGPFVVTHLVCDSANEAEKATATLPQPLAIVDSEGATLKRAQTVKLKWLDIRGAPVAAPPFGSPIEALYFRPLRATSRATAPELRRVPARLTE